MLRARRVAVIVLIGLGCGVASSASPAPAVRPTVARPVVLAASRPSVAAAPPARLIVVLDPGHNGGNASHLRKINRLVPAGFGKRKRCNTTGTATNAGYPEHAFAWDVARRVRRLLLLRGIDVIMTRPDDAGVGPCVNRRAKIESTPGVVAAVSFHADGAPSSGHGFHVNTASRRPAGASAATVARSQRLARALHDALIAGTGLVPSTYIGRNGYVRRSDLAGLNLSTSPTCLLELGNMRNAGDARRLHSVRGRRHIARAVVAGILAYLGR